MGSIHHRHPVWDACSLLLYIHTTVSKLRDTFSFSRVPELVGVLVSRYTLSSARTSSGWSRVGLAFLEDWGSMEPFLNRTVTTLTMKHYDSHVGAP